MPKTSLTSVPQRRQAAQLKLALRVARFVGQQRRRGGDDGIGVEKLDQRLQRARLELAIGIEQKEVAAARARGDAIDAGREADVRGRRE